MNQMDGAARLANVMAEEETGGGRLLASRRLRPELREECAGLISEHHGGKREDEGAKGRPQQIHHALRGSGRHGRRAGLRHRRRYERGREEGGGGGGGPGAAAMGGRGRRED